MKAENELTQVIQELKDINDIKKLKATYCHLVDSGSWNELEALWLDDAVCDYGFFGCYSSRKEIIDQFFRNKVNQVSSFNAHMIHNDIIDIKGDEATGKWYLTAQTTIEPNRQAIWVHALYDDKFVRTKDGWKIAQIKVDFRYFTPFEKGWAKVKFWNPEEKR